MHLPPADHGDSPLPSSWEQGTRRALYLWITLALLVVTAAVYAPVSHYSFVNFDDPDIVGNPTVRAGLTWPSFIWAWTANLEGNRHPLTTLSHMLDCQLFGFNPGPQHLVNVGFHVMNTLLLFGVLARMTAQPWRSACVAALFALHPLHVESVAWISERKDVLSTFFWMLTLWAYVGYVRRHSGRRYAVLMLAGAAALLSKAMAVTLPATLFLLDIWPLRRIQGFEGSSERQSVQPPTSNLESRLGQPLDIGGDGPSSWRTLLLEKLPLVFLSAIAAAITFFTQVRVPFAVIPLSDRAANAVVSYATYLVQMVWPARLAAVYIFEAPLPAWKIIGSTALLIGVTGLVLTQMRPRPYLLVGWLWYLGTLVPVIGFVSVGMQARADRFTYLPLIGIFIMAAWGIPDLLGRWKYRRLAEGAIAGLAITACTVLTARQLRYWENSISLFGHALSVTRNNWVAELNLGAALAEQGRLDESARHTAEGTRLRRDTEARHYARVLRSDPASVEAHVKLARLLEDGGDADGAAAHYREVIRLQPNLAAAHNNLAVLLESTGHTEEAIAEYREGAHLEPQRAESRANLAAALANAGRPAEAIEQFRAALQLKPQFAGDADVLNSLAAAYAEAGRFAEAADVAAKALEIAQAAQRTALSTALAERLARYRAGQPERDQRQ